MKEYTSKVIEIVRGIPEGRVMTYGQIATMAGSPRAARQVVRILHSMSASYRLPWHRVVNLRGEIALQEEEARFTQMSALEAEGVYVDASGKIDLAEYLVRPEEIEGKRQGQWGKVSGKRKSPQTLYP